MKNNKLLSIIMPTYNRVDLLKNTISLLLEQVVRNSEEVDLIICNNASTDGTKEYLNTLDKRDGLIIVYNYDDHVDIGNSITRSAANSDGKFFLFWSDDDTPSPCMIDTILIYLNKYPDIGCIHYNRLQGGPSDNGVDITNLKVYNPKPYSTHEVVYEDLEPFVINYFVSMGFLSADVVSTDVWKNGMCAYPNNHVGYEFLSPIFVGLKGKKCLYINYPLCIQRVLHRTRYAIDWPKYVFVGAPRMLDYLNGMGIIHEWREDYYNSYFMKSDSFFLHVVLYCTLDKKRYWDVLNEMCNYQKSKFRKIALRFIMYCIPGSLFAFYLKMRYNTSL